jgi:HSP20 family molecular chaperone IbpA
MVLYVPVVMEQQPLLFHQPRGGLFGRHPRQRLGGLGCHPNHPMFGGHFMPDCFMVRAPEQESKEKQRDQTAVAPAEDFQLKLDVEGFKPEEVQVKMIPSKRSLLVTATKEHEEDGFKFTQNIQRVVYIPKGFNLDKVDAKVNQEGVLVIRAERLDKNEVAHDKKEAVEQRQEDQMEVEKSEETNVDTSVAAPEQVEDEQRDEPAQASSSPVQDEDSTEKDDFEVVNVQVVQSDEAAEQQQKTKEDEEATQLTSQNGQENMEEEVNKDEKPKQEEAPVSEEVEKTPENFKRSVDVNGFSPENISVEVTDDGRLRVSAQRVEEDGGVTQLSREFVVDAANFDLDAMTSTLTKQGLLEITAPAKKTKKTVSIPVNIIQ